ncbi:HhH-GPD family protein [Chloroflexus aggregans]|uniref:Adenine DNA glycosylase n=1 Tax=Chloroflexus aggregans (strain MD-66 / DSM 9485) TaxID=326427 RepID=B8G400_CHLAD|nr:A/G-specific adenine glycosylase [Chloroflexus aggregans]ACL25402.1 HhH-GPD family protein [Chloroflexus aggregans DSM 9485]
MIEQIRSDLLHWFHSYARDLPWRRTRDPYAIMVAEVMLQQTQVDRVIPKYQAFLSAFPTVAALAAAPTAEVIRLWAGLGYNRRAVNLQRAAQVIMEQYGGQVPSAVADLRALPGIGPYTAGAIACFAFEQDVAFLDTNIRRVVRRLCVGPDDRSTPSDGELLAHATALIPPGQGWTWNQAIMELGALICTSTNPACWRCPLRSYCRSYATAVADDTALAATMMSPPLKRVAESRTAEPFVGSRRWYRGKIVAVLRELPAGEVLPLPILGERIRADFTPDHEPWLQGLVADLARDGLLVMTEEGVRLPQ